MQENLLCLILETNRSRNKTNKKLLFFSLLLKVFQSLTVQTSLGFVFVIPKVTTMVVRIAI